MRCLLFMYLLSFGLSQCTSHQTTPDKREIGDAKDTLTLVGEGWISTYLNERDLAISDADSELFYTLSDFENKASSIVVAKRTGATWSPPEVAPFSSDYRDLEPFLSPDNQRLYFASNRPLSAVDSTNDYNIWYVERISNSWSTPVAMPEIINSASDEFFPSVASNGNIYFTASYQDSKGLEDIYISEYKNGLYTKPVSLDSAINSPLYEFNAYIASDESFLLFSSFGRPDGYGGGDLYISRKINQSWQAAANLGPDINSDQLDYCPFYHQRSNTLFFTSNRSGPIPDGRTVESFRLASNRTLNSMGNLYQIKFPGPD